MTCFVQLPHDGSVSLPHINARRAEFHLDIPASEVSAGSIVGIFGHSGSGKTIYAKKLFEHLGPLQVEFLPQQDSLLEDVTTAQNVLLASDPTLSSGKLDEQLKRSARLLDLGDRLDRFARQLSGGERRRALLMRSFAAPASILVLDEPFVGLGWRDEVRAREFVRRERNRFRLIIVISHSAELLWSLSDLIWVFNEGTRVAEVDPKAPSLDPMISMEVADSLGVTNIVNIRVLEDLCEETVFVSEALENNVAFWLSDTAATPGRPRGDWSFMGRVRLAVADLHRYCVRGRRIVELRGRSAEPTAPIFLQDQTEGREGSEMWIGVRSFIRVRP